MCGDCDVLQIDILPGQGAGGTPLNNSVELERPRSPDTSDGLRFTDLFTVSQSRQQCVTGNTPFSPPPPPLLQQQQQQQQQQQPAEPTTQCAPDMFLAR